MSKSLRLAFMGTPEFAVSALQALVDSHHEVVCVYSQPPRPKGRGQKLQKSPVHVLAEEAGIEVRTPINFKNAEDVTAFQELNLDVAVVAAYGLILPPVILDAPTYGCLNIHASLLPRWRGAAPIHRAIHAGDTETGITIMQMDVGLDTGDMIAIGKTPITADANLSELHDVLSAMGAAMIVLCLDTLAQNGALDKTPQPLEGMTYAKMLTKEEGRIDWTQSAAEISAQVRAFNPWPGTWSLNQNNKRLKIVQAHPSPQKSDKPAGEVLANGFMACGQGSVLELKIIQPENKKPMDIKTALNGGHINIGDVLS